MFEMSEARNVTAHGSVFWGDLILEDLRREQKKRTIFGEKIGCIRKK